MTFRQFAQIVEVRTKIVSVSTFSTALLYVVWRTSRPGYPRAASGAHALYAGDFLLKALLCAVAVLFVDMGTTAFNSYFDYLRGVDSPKTNREEDKLILSGEVEPGSALMAALSCFAAAGTLGIALAVLSGFWIILAGGISMAVGFLYNGGPHPISRSPVGEIFAGGFLGSVLFIIAARLLSGSFEWLYALASLPSFFLVASILAANNTCDMAGDREAGRRTFAIVFGAKASEFSIYFEGVLAFGLPAAFAFVGVLPIWSAASSALAAAAALPFYRRMALRGYSHSTKGQSMSDIARITAIWTLGVAVGLAAGIVAG